MTRLGGVVASGVCDVWGGFSAFALVWNTGAVLDKGIHALRDDRKDHPFVRLNGQAGRWRMTGLTKVVEIPIVISFDDASVRPPVSPLPDRLPGRWPLRLNSDWRGYQPDFGDHWSGDGDAIPGGRDGPGCQGGIGIGAYTVLVFSPDRS